MTLSSLKPEISQALGSLLDELRCIEDTKAMCIGSTTPKRKSSSGQGRPRCRPFLSCILCKSAGRPHTSHNLMDCNYLPDCDRRPWARSRMVMNDPEDLGVDQKEPFDESSDLVVPPTQVEERAALRVSKVQSPVLHTFYHEHPVQLTLVTGTTWFVPSPSIFLFSPSLPPPKWLIRLMELPQWMSLAKSTAR